MISLEISPKIPRGINKSLIRKAVRIAYKKTGLKVDGKLNLAFVSASKSKKLNNKYSGNNYATDVLSFAYEPIESWHGQEVADIAICTPVAKAQAKQYGTSLADEAALLAVHGVLHSLGFDHNTELSQASLNNLQNAIMKESKINSREFFDDQTS